jgi:hypothetical protein
VTIQAVGAISSATSALARDFTPQGTLIREAQELRAWLGRAPGAVPSASTPGPATPSAPTEMQTLMTPNTPPASANGKLDTFM